MVSIEWRLESFSTRWWTLPIKLYYSYIVYRISVSCRSVLGQQIPHCRRYTRLKYVSKYNASHRFAVRFTFYPYPEFFSRRFTPLQYLVSPLPKQPPQSTYDYTISSIPCVVCIFVSESCRRQPSSSIRTDMRHDRVHSVEFWLSVRLVFGAFVSLSQLYWHSYITLVP